MYGFGVKTDMKKVLEMSAISENGEGRPVVDVVEFLKSFVFTCPFPVPPSPLKSAVMSSLKHS